ncbi:unnamed protein product [Polarella glacialis]|uniref:Phospholipid scramblase n=1 Tax=Polarella glacialis TaxID=89957 RepID=A0A813IHR3_POLGL|nr:unnamed protein product [Polarella glacialis]|eukprot:CAMPEP_0115132904 /NCGR_PEP_ID=MMETSP0227-20121206/54063_1 /TAXON_ID=89957 /ORGANISM="Polarella glacialis, Strain CCMP 1383" /LENGTH=289 /DNA_ID=CAMNT_0002538851 /DNA_START=39 /DNA_END=908 /DNA_ORIENTATION=-
MFQVQIPAGATAGSTIQAQSPHGNTIQVTIPESMQPGQMIQVIDPSAPQTVGAPQQQQMMGGFGPGMDIFQGASKVLVKQEFAIMEMFGCEAKNRYRISVPVGDGRQEGQVFLYINEESECFERICCSVNRSLTLHVHHGHDKNGPVVQSMHKPFSIQGCICCRPSFEVYGAGGPGDKIGTVQDPWRCCLMDQQIYGKQGEVLFTTTGSICQLGMCCRCCADIDFDIIKDKEKVGKISKLSINPCECVMETNRFIIEFGNLQGVENRKMLLASAMLLDLQYFEENKNKK